MTPGDWKRIVEAPGGVRQMGVLTTAVMIGTPAGPVNVPPGAYRSHVYNPVSGQFWYAAPYPASEWTWDNFFLRYHHANGDYLLCDVCDSYAVVIGLSGPGRVSDKARCRKHEHNAVMTPVPAPNAVPVRTIQVPVAKAEPEMCWERYSGIECQCSKQHRLPGSRR